MIKKKKALVAEAMPEFQASIDAMPADSKIFVDKSLEIADYIFQLMEKKEMKQKDLADLMEKSEAEISKILGGMHNLTLRTIAKLEAALQEDVICTPKHSQITTRGLKMPAELNDVISKVPEQTAPMDYGSECRVVSIYKNKENGNKNGSWVKAI